MINKNSKLLSIREFENDKYLFSILFENLLNSSFEVYSDEENYIICKGEQSKPIWIWTKDNLNENVLLQIQQIINNYLDGNDNVKFICKPQLYLLLKNNNFECINVVNDNEIGFLMCNNIKRPNICDGYIYIPNFYDIDILSDYYYKNCLETKGVNTLTYDQARLYIEKIIKDGSVYSNNDNTIYGWKNFKNKIVSLAIYSSIGNCAKINNVFTPIEERRRGYASNLIYTITKEILNDDLIPIVYLNNNSNCNYNLYKSIGYVKSGTLINFTYSRSKIKRK